MIDVGRYLAALEEEGLIRPEDLAGCTERDLAVLSEAQGVRRIPLVYREFLLAAGRRTAGLMQGSDWTYAHLLKIKEYARDLLRENGMTAEILDGSLVFLMHQGYAFYYFPADVLDQDDPPVWLYEEGADSVRLSMESFSGFLAIAEEGLRVLRRVEKNNPEIFVSHRKDHSN